MEKIRANHDPVPAHAAGKAHIESLKAVMHSVRGLPRGLYGITSEQFGHTHAASARIFLEAGFEIVQYRGKSNGGEEKPVRQMISDAIGVKDLCADYGALFIVDDRVDVAAASGAAGVHVGQSDIPVEYARRQFGGIIGASAATAAEASEAAASGASYIGAGGVFASSTKPDNRVIGLIGLQKVIEAASVPVYAIGGINAANIAQVGRLGAAGAVVISAVLGARDPVAEARKLVGLWGRASDK